MQIFTLTLENAPLIAKMMAKQVPEWWNFDDALKQITAPGKISWYIGENAETPKGFICVKELDEYSCIEMEICAYDGEYVASEKIAALFEKMEQYALEKGLRMARTIMSSYGMSCHGRKVANYTEELSALTSISKEYEYMLSRGYKLAGFLPNCYGINIHGIMIVKDLCE